MTSTPEVMDDAMQRAQSDEADRQKRPFAEVPARRSVEELLRNVQQALVAYTGQADLKANIVITTSSLVLTIVATRWSERSLRPGLAAVAIGTMLALLTAITVVIPKFRFPRKGEVRHDFEPHENPLFFGHFASMPRDRFVEIIAEIAADDTGSTRRRPSMSTTRAGTSWRRSTGTSDSPTSSSRSPSSRARPRRPSQRWSDVAARHQGRATSDGRGGGI
jgi:Family of unknown function (DUF5706)